jgi:hypothetical protein
MTREEAEKRVWDKWSYAEQHNMRCELQIEPTLTEEYEWGWVIFLAPVRREECTHRYPFRRFACERQGGRSAPVGTKGLQWSLQYLGLVTESDLHGRSQPEVKEIWKRFTTPRA